jgi:hypothetical protein
LKSVVLVVELLFFNTGDELFKLPFFVTLKSHVLAFDLDSELFSFTVEVGRERPRSLELDFFFFFVVATYKIILYIIYEEEKNKVFTESTLCEDSGED